MSLITPDTGSDDADRARGARHGRMLEELAELGMDLARLVHERAVAVPPEAPEDLARAVGSFALVSRAVRQTVALEAKLARDAAARDFHLGYLARSQPERPPAVGQRVVGAGTPELAQLQTQVFLEQFLTREAGGDAERLLDDLAERLADPGLEPLYGTRPLAEIVTAICRDLGLPAERIEDAAEIVTCIERDFAGLPTGRSPPFGTGPPR